MRKRKETNKRKGDESIILLFYNYIGTGRFILFTH